MTHSFDVDIAVLYGVNAAILLQNIYFWCEHNRANEQHFHDGNYWTYNSVKAFNELFPYISEKQIRTALKTLEREGLIVTGTYNSNAYDRTRWYAVTEKGKSILHKEKSILPKGQMDLQERENGFAREGEPIPDINTDSKHTDINTDILPDNNSVCATHTHERANANPKEPKKPKETFGEYGHVLLTTQEYKRLVADYGNEKAKKAVQFLDEYIEEKGYKSKSHYLAIRRWVVSALGERQQAPKNGRTNSGDYDWEAVLQSLDAGNSGG